MAETKTKGKSKSQSSKSPSNAKPQNSSDRGGSDRSHSTKSANNVRSFSTSDILAPEAVATLKEQLLSKRQRIVDLYAADVRAGQEATQEGTDDIVDRANNSYSRELMFSLSSAEREQLLEVDAALRRIDEGTYGFCQHSGKPIALARLQAIPWARYSIEYQELAEKGLLEEEGGHGAS